MNDRLKHKLYNLYLADTPIKFESVTDEQFKQLQNTLAGASCTFVSAVEDVTSEIVKRFSAMTSKSQERR